MPLENLPPNADQGFSTSSALLAVAIAAWGGLVSYMQRLRTGKQRFSFREFFADITSSMLAGFIVYGLAKAVEFPEWGSVALTALAGHYGTRTIFLLRNIIVARADKFRDG